MSEVYQKLFEEYIQKSNLTNNKKPERFIEILHTHKGIIDFLHIDDEDNMELRNPLIVVIGDSVSGGHFEMLDSEHMLSAQDLEDSYVDKFRYLLHDKYPMTTPSIINSGIAGDNIHGMNKRLDRDVISHQPDLVIINATLNWSINRGTLENYASELESTIMRILQGTQAEIILMTPNMAIATEKDPNFCKRAEVVRNLAQKYDLPLADVYKMWEDVLLKEEDLPDLLSNQENHPTPLGHTYMARAIMQCF